MLAKAGIVLNPRVRPESLLLAFTREQFEGDPYRLLLCVMGEEGEDAEYPSDQIWHFDTECIEGDWSYIRIATRMATLAGDALPLEQIGDSVDLEAGTAWLSFALDGQTYRWDVEVNDDWVDSSVLSRFAQLLEARKVGRRFTYVDLKGQDCLIGCATRGREIAVEISYRINCGMAEVRRWKAEQFKTGRRGYLGRLGLVQRRNSEPRSETTSFL